MAATATKAMNYEFTTDDDELNDDGTKDQASMCNIYKLSLPASASILSKQIAKSQAKRAKKEEKHRRRVDLSTVREQDETKLSASEENASPLPARLEDVPSAPASQFGGRSRIDSAPAEVKLKRQASLPEERTAEPMDDEEAQLLAMLLSGIEQNRRKQSMNEDATRPQGIQGIQNFHGLQNLQNPFQMQMSQTLPSPGLPRMPPSAKVSEWLLERSTSPDNVSVVSSVLLEDSGLVLSYPNEEDDEEDVFFDANDEVEKKNSEDVVKCVEHEMQGLSLNRNMSAMTNSLVRVEEETVTDGGGMADILGMKRTGRSTSVSPRPTTEQFVRNANGSATFNVKHSSTLARTQKFNSPMMLNGNMSMSQQMTSTPLSSRTTRSVLRVHNVNSVPAAAKKSTPPSFPMQSTTISMSKSTTSPAAAITNHRVYRQPEPPSVRNSPPVVTIAPSTPSRPASVASSVTARSTTSAVASPMSNLAGLQDLIQMQEDALRKAALNASSHSEQTPERKMSWHSDQEANRQSTSTHSSLGSLSSSKSIDGAHALSKLGNNVSRIPTPRSRLPTPRTSTLPKRVHSVAAATRLSTPKSEFAVHSGGTPATTDSVVDECF